MIKIGDKIVTPKGIGVVSFIEFDIVHVFIEAIASSDFPGMPASNIHKFNIDAVKFYYPDGANRWYNE